MDRPVTPASNAYGASVQSEAHPLTTGSRPVSYLGSALPGHAELENSQGAPRPTSTLTQDQDMNHVTQPEAAERSSTLQRSNSQMSQSHISRGGTLKKKPSLSRTGSLKRSGSRKSSYAGSVRSMKLGEKEKYGETEESNSVFYCPVPTTGNPTEQLANRFQTWRKVLKDLINYFRDLHKSYEVRAKTLLQASNVINNTSIPSDFLTSGGLGDAIVVLRDFHKQSLNESNKAKDLENEVIMQLTGLRSDLQQKIKEIKSLSGDFKNSVDKEQDGTKRAIKALQDALGGVDHDAAASSGKGDPFLIKMGVDRQVEKQIEEENYLHRAYLNLEASGRELESIVVGEIQKAYNVLAGIMRREADDSYDAAEKLREGPLNLTKDFEWDQFVTGNKQMVDPRNPVRQVDHITYPGKDHPAALEVRGGMLERKSKYLKNYTPGWYMLSPTHLHEFKSADRIASQTPIMSLYLPEQKLGTHSDPGSSSHKFMLKGRQSGSMHRGHSWVFRAESHDTMLAWFADIKELTEKTGEARNEFVRKSHARSRSGSSLKAASIHSSEGGMEDDDADRVAFAGEQSVRGQSVSDGLPVAGAIGADADDARSNPGWRPERPQPGGRFPSEVNVQRGLQEPLSPSSGHSSNPDRDALAGAAALPGSSIPFSNTTQPHNDLQYGSGPVAASQVPSTQYTHGQHSNVVPTTAGAHPVSAPEGSQYGEWMAPIAVGAGGAAVGAGVAHHYSQQTHAPAETAENSTRQMDGASAVPVYGTSSVPIPVTTTQDSELRSGSRPRGLTESTEAPTMATSFAATASSHTDATTVSTADTTPTEYSHKPSLEQTKSAKSVATVSDLHMPGEYPRTPAGDLTPSQDRYFA